MNNIAVFCFVEHGGKILLVKKNYGNKSWTFPGGAVAPQEAIVDALAREVKEETGQTISTAEYVAAFYSKDNYSIALCFCISLEKLDDITFDESEISDVKLFEMDNLPQPMSPRYVFWLKTYRDRKNNLSQNLFQYA